jgi:predicted transcriptional regulator YdeE
MESDSKPRIEALDAFHVVGLEKLCEHGVDNQIPALWDKLFARWEEIKGFKDFYGVCLPREDGQPGFRYLACARVEPGSAPPAGMDRAEVPAMKYAVYPFHDLVSAFPAKFEEIYGRLLAADRLTPHPSYQCLEYYQPDCYDEETKKIRADIFVSIV